MSKREAKTAAPVTPQQIEDMNSKIVDFVMSSPLGTVFTADSVRIGINEPELSTQFITRCFLYKMGWVTGSARIYTFKGIDALREQVAKDRLIEESF